MEGMNQVLFRIVEDATDGRHLIAIRDIKAGELIFTESPSVYSPGQHEDTCLVCLKRTGGVLCRQCWWPVCSDQCSGSQLHKTECRHLAACLTSGEDTCLPVRHLLPLRCLLMKENNPRSWDRLLRLRGHHGEQEIIRTDEENIQDFAYRDLAVFIWNDCGLSHVTPDQLSMVYSLTKHSSLQILLHGAEYPAIYLTAALMTQSCISNTRCVFKGRDNKLFLYAATNIRKGEKLLHSWTKNLLETQTSDRQKILRELFLQCKCQRCTDPSELETNISGLQCQKCDGLVLPHQCHHNSHQWQCSKCSSEYSNNFVETLLMGLQEDKGDMDKLLEKSKGILSPNHFFTLSEKLRYFFTCEDEGMDKIEIGRNILKIADKLEPGLSVTKEKILIQLGLSLQEFIGSLLVEYLMNEDHEELKQQENLLLESFVETKKHFQTALSCSRLEDALDGSKETSTKELKQCLLILDEMQSHFDAKRRDS